MSLPALKLTPVCGVLYRRPIAQKIQDMTRKRAGTPGFEKALQELEALVEKMEQGELSLEESLQHFEKGVQLSRTCQQALRDAEQKVEILMQKNAQEETVPFDSEDA
jgi:exodeoxyribonuclease VII small subunit